MEDKTLERAMLETILKKPKRRKIYEKRKTLLKHCHAVKFICFKAFFCSFFICFVFTYFLVLQIREYTLPY
ncbi:hypothetical protein NEIG_01610 [Nematocida sp. ERTm5]|nr:hypothetical protein NEIG_01610 [Nematocida sp. ERTm5]